MYTNQIRYNALGYHPMIDYRNKEFHNNLNLIKPILQSITNNTTRALDLGCNAGKYSFMLEEIGAKVTGVDYAESTIKIAREIANELNSSCTFLVENILDMSFNDNSFDIAIFPLNIIEFSYEEVDKLCRELKKVLADEGVFCITMEDGLNRIVCGMDSADKYQGTNGIHTAVQNIPEKGSYEYRTYFWTIAFAKHIIAQHFMFSKEIKLSDNKYYIEFRNVIELT
ncbi:MAG: class I SAM-dependent methyltransferase [Clostridium sp.]